MAVIDDDLMDPVEEDTDLVLMRYVPINVGGSKVPLLQAHLTSVGPFKVYERGAQVGTSGTLTVAGTVSDTLLTGTIWSKTTTGYNFSFALSRIYIPEGGRLYTVEVPFVLTGGERFTKRWKIPTINLLSS